MDKTDFVYQYEEELTFDEIKYIDTLVDCMFLDSNKKKYIKQYCDIFVKQNKINEFINYFLIGLDNRCHDEKIVRILIDTLMKQGYENKVYFYKIFGKPGRFFNDFSFLFFKLLTKYHYKFNGYDILYVLEKNNFIDYNKNSDQMY